MFLRKISVWSIRDKVMETPTVNSEYICEYQLKEHLSGVGFIISHESFPVKTFDDAGF